MSRLQRPLWRRIWVLKPIRTAGSPQLGQHEIGSRTHVELWNENDLITKALVGAELRLIVRERILEAMLSFVVVAEDFRPRWHHEDLLIVAKSPNSLPRDVPGSATPGAPDR